MARNMVYPEGYASSLSQRDTQRAIKVIKDAFQVNLANALNLDRVTAPIMVREDSGLNDDLSGIERKVHFTMKEIPGTAQVVQSLAKWKRMALYRYGYRSGEGIYTDMNAIRRDDDVDAEDPLDAGADRLRLLFRAERRVEGTVSAQRQRAGCGSVRLGLRPERH